MRRVRLSEILLFAGAFLLRLGWAAEMSAYPFFDLPTGDGLFYARQAARIASGHFLGEGLSYPSSPLYPYLLAPIFLLEGRTLFWMIYGLQSLLDASSAVLLARCGASLFGSRAGWLAGIAWALYGPAVFFTADGVEATAAAFFANLFLWLFVSRRSSADERSPEDAREPSRLPITALCGVALGAACLLRPHFLPLLPAALAGAALLAPAGRRGVAAAAFAAGAALVLTLSLARNVAVSGEPVLVSPYSGLNAYLGNRRGAKGDLSFPAGRGLRAEMDLERSARSYPESMAGRSLSAAEVSRFWWRETGREILADPPGWIRLVARKARLFWSSRASPNHLDIDAFRPDSAALSMAAVSPGLIGPLALVGIALTAAGPLRNARSLITAFLIALYWACCVIFFVVDRFRLPVAGWLCLFAGGALAWIVSEALRHRWLAVAGGTAAAIVLAATLHDEPPVKHGVHERLMAASVLLGRGRVEEAERLVRSAVEIAPDSARARYNLGRLFARTGRVEDAAREMEESLRLDPDLAAAHAALGDLARRKGTPEGDEEASRRWERALAIEPYGPEADRLRQEIERLGRGRASGPTS